MLKVISFTISLFFTIALNGQTTTQRSIAGTWHASLFEFNQYQEVFVNIHEDGSYYGRIYQFGILVQEIFATWKYNEQKQVLYEYYPDGKSSASSVEWISNNHVKLTILRNQLTPLYEGIIRHYYRVN